nr:glucosaminidase domain-containing protein [Streptococcus saliviloxodontae]
MIRGSVPNAKEGVKTSYDHSAFFKLVAPQVQRLSDSYGVKTSVILAQAALESDYGTDLLAVRYHNLMAVKAEAGQRSVKMTRQEYIGTKQLSLKSQFRVYVDWESSLNDYMLQLKDGKLSRSGLYKAVATADNYQTAIEAFQKYNYTSDTNYSKKLKKIIETYNLVDYNR